MASPRPCSPVCLILDSPTAEKTIANIEVSTPRQQIHEKSDKIPRTNPATAIELVFGGTLYAVCICIVGLGVAVFGGIIGSAAEVA